MAGLGSRLNLYTQSSAENFYQKIKDLEKLGSIQTNQEYEIELGGGVYIFQGQELLEAKDVFSRIDQADNQVDGYLVQYAKLTDSISEDPARVVSKWGRNVLTVSYQDFLPFETKNIELDSYTKSFTLTEDEIYRLAAQNKLYWDREKKFPIKLTEGLPPDDIHSLAELALTYGVNSEVMKAFQHYSAPYACFFCLDRNYMGGTGIASLISPTEPDNATIVLSLEAKLPGVSDAADMQDGIRGMSNWLNHERGHVLMWKVGAIVQQPVGPYQNFNQIMAGKDKFELFLELWNYFRKTSSRETGDMAYQFVYFTQEICDPVVAAYHSEIGLMFKANEVNVAIDERIEDPSELEMTPYRMMKVAWIIQLGKYYQIDPVKLRVLKDRTLEKLQEKDKVIFEKLLNWFEHVQTKFNELFQTFNNHFGQIIKRDEHQAQ